MWWEEEVVKVVKGGVVEVIDEVVYDEIDDSRCSR